MYNVEILLSISQPDYVESDLLTSLEHLRETNETDYVGAFLQFIVGCAELDISVTAGTCFPSVILRTGQEPEKFLAYRDPRLGNAIDGFLRGFLADGKPFEIVSWTEKVFELLRALIRAGEKFAVCGLFFVMRLLIHGYCVQGNGLISGSPNLRRFCKSLFYLHDPDLITDENCADVTQKLIYVFQFYWPQVLSGSDSEHIRHLTALIFINNSQLQKDVMKTITIILEDPTATNSIRIAVLSELVMIKDILIAMCHKDPQSVALSALALICANSADLTAEESDKDKIFLLMCKPYAKIQEMARTFFLECVSRSEEPDQNRTFLTALERLIAKYQDAQDNWDKIVAVLIDCFPSFVDVYLYIIRHNSQVISYISVKVILLMMESSEDTLELHAMLSDVARLSGEALRQVFAAGQWNIYQDLLQNFRNLPDVIFAQIPSHELKGISSHLLAVMDERYLNRECGRTCVELWLKIEEASQGSRIYSGFSIKFDRKWIPIGFLLEQWQTISDGELQDISQKVDDAMRHCPENVLDLINVKHWIIIRTTDHSMVIQDTIWLLVTIGDQYFGSMEEMTCRPADLLRIIVQLMLNLIRFLPWASEDQVVATKAFEGELMVWITRSTKRSDKDVQQCMANLLEFSTIWMDVDKFVPYLVAMLQSTESRGLVPDIFSAIGRNRFLTLERKVTQLELILAKALHILNNGSNVKNACSKLLSSFVGQFTDSEVLVAVLIRLLSSTQENVSLSTRNNLHRFKSLDALADRLPKSISPANRRIVSSIVGDILCLELADAEKATMKKIMSRMQ